MSGIRSLSALTVRTRTLNQIWGSQHRPPVGKCTNALFRPIATPAFRTLSQRATRLSVPWTAPIAQTRRNFWSSKTKEVEEPVATAAQTSAVPTPPSSTDAISPPVPPTDAITTTTSTTPSFLSDPTLLDATLQPALTSISHLGDLKTLGLCNSTPAGLAQSLIEAVYVTTGLPWWATIMATTLLIRVALTPLILRVQRSSAKMNNISHKTKPLQDEMTRLRAEGDMVGAQKALQKLREEYKNAGVNPLGGLIALVQAPVFISFFFGLKGMAELPVPGFETGGLAWFANLSIPDPTYVLPIVASLGMLAVMELGAEMGTQVNNAQTATFKNVLRIALIGSIPFTAQLPSAIFMYWISTNAFTLLQTFALKNPSFRRLCNIPALNPVARAVQHQGMAQIQKLSFAESMKMVKQAAEERKKREETALEAAKKIRTIGGIKRRV
ncbi:YidC/Oxa1 family membrane protein insertase [Spizellomyces punctatus DAOM BR117]|uniref:YidC/Oxa1 family membrane protein insertase n=1 Tax=Spizellomyces punctatus (strain DAOM BR117) TaxID=645134 RepID=A0A0L0HN09_SPIPD|nr:YidC/Oxa1 family membrane protein insertase [Spizellomyces punctatus DAOM BR117]KND02806.1 YidC/Oxa1 family membrane protein insertase [Spizellomyces punctatus DAOM BR117]|eukprot:XP_016610845.1 YidC/Oxa1 family membrane protein insertase [Spizellomyces punctatus DAOM BR117]